MNILIIADHFPPSFAPRMGYLTRNLKTMGHEVYVVAITKHRNFNSFDFLTGYADAVYEVDPLKMSHKDVLKSTVKGFLTTLRPMWTETDTAYYEKCVEVEKRHHIDCVLCSTSSFYPLLVAERMMARHIPTVLDFRDIYEQDETFFSRRGLAGIMRHFQKKIRNRIVGKADAVVSVSDWHCKYLSKWNSECNLIMNGYDEQRFEPQAEWEGKRVRIVYAGTIATPHGDITAHSPVMLFEAIRDMAAEKRARLELVFYTDDNSKRVIDEVIAEYNLETVARGENWVASDKVPELLAQSSALLILSNHGSKGMMMTKSFEYMAMNRPILCLPNPEPQLEGIIKETGTGVVIRDKESAIQVLESLVEGTLYFSPDLEAVRKYSRMAQAKQFEELFSKILSNRNV